MTDKSLEARLAPSSPEAEEALLGSIIYNPDLMAEVEKEIKVEDFFIIRNAWVYETMLTIHRRGEIVDETSIYVEMKAFTPDRLREMGGRAYITQLINATPGYMHWWTFLCAIREASRQRKVVTLSAQIAQAAVSADTEGFDRRLQELNDLKATFGSQQNDLAKYLIHASELENLPPLRWLLKGEIPDQSLIMIYGESGVGKSFFTLDYALRFAQSMPVVYVASEGQYGYQGRVRAWKQHNHLDVGQLHIYMNMIPLVISGERGKFKAIVAPIRPRVIVVDTVAYCLAPGDENSTKDMSLFVKSCLELVTDLNCAVILVHHSGIEGQRARGSTALIGAVATSIQLKGDDDLIEVSCKKQKDGKAFPTRYIRLLPVALDDGETSQVVISAEKVITGPEDPLTDNQKRILVCLAETFPHGASPSELEDTLGIKRGVIQKILGRLVKLGYASQMYAKEPYEITPQGKTKIGILTPPTPVRLQSDSSRKPHNDALTPLTPPKRVQEDTRALVGEEVESVESGGFASDDDDLTPVLKEGGVGWSQRSQERNGGYKTEHEQAALLDEFSRKLTNYDAGT